jgi:hypothetical protein
MTVERPTNRCAFWSTYPNTVMPITSGFDSFAGLLICAAIDPAGPVTAIGERRSAGFGFVAGGQVQPPVGLRAGDLALHYSVHLATDG